MLPLAAVALSNASGSDATLRSGSAVAVAVAAAVAAAAFATAASDAAATAPLPVTCLGAVTCCAGRRAVLLREFYQVNDITAVPAMLLGHPGFGTCARGAPVGRASGCSTGGGRDSTRQSIGPATTVGADTATGSANPTDTGTAPKGRVRASALRRMPPPACAPNWRRGARTAAGFQHDDLGPLQPPSRRLWGDAHLGRGEQRQGFPDLPRLGTFRERSGSRCAVRFLITAVLVVLQATAAAREIPGVLPAPGGRCPAPPATVAASGVSVSLATGWVSDSCGCGVMGTVARPWAVMDVQ